jgi:hypothetical protein
MQKEYFARDLSTGMTRQNLSTIKSYSKKTFKLTPRRQASGDEGAGLHANWNEQLSAAL